MKISLFPRIDLVSLLEMQFKIQEILGIKIDDDIDFLHFNWLYNRILQKLKAQNDQFNDLHKSRTL